jgi:hypothetical protein
MIKLIEGIAASNKNLKGLALKVTFQEGDTAHTEFDLVKDALLDWQRTHGAACGALEIEYQAHESGWAQIEQFWVNKSKTDPLIQALLQRVGYFDLCMVTPTGNKIRRIGFELGANK